MRGESELEDRKRRIVLLFGVLATSCAFAAQFKPKDSNNYLDVAENWNGFTGAMAVQAANLRGDKLIRLSASPATFPATATASLSYLGSSCTNDFGSGNILNLGSFTSLYAEQGGEMYHKSGIINGPVYIHDKWTGSTVVNAGRIVLDGADAELRPTAFQTRSYTTTTAPVYPQLIVTNGAKVVMQSSATFEMCGGWASAHVLFSGSGSSLTADKVVMGKKFGADVGQNTGYQDKPGEHRTLEFSDGAVGTIPNLFQVGAECGGNIVKVNSGATLDVSNDIAYGPETDNGSFAGCTNNEIIVDGGAVKTLAAIRMGRFAASTGNRLEVKNGGTVSLLGTDKSCIVGYAGGGNTLSIAGAGSLVAATNSWLRIGGYDTVSSSGNVVEVKDGGEIFTTKDVYLGNAGGADNVLSVSGGGFFTGKNLYMRGTRPRFLADGATFTFDGENVQDEDDTTGTVVGLTNATLRAKRLIVKASDGVVATSNATISLDQCFYIGDGTKITLVDTRAAVSINVTTGSLVGFGGNGSEFELRGGSVFDVNMTTRLYLKGNGFVFRVNDSTVNYTNTTDWFITQQSVTVTDARYVFEGARPYFKTTGNGFYLRGGRIDLEFNIGKDGFPTDRPVIDLQNGGKFSADSKSANQITVNIAANCPAGVYSLMKGTAAGTFLNDECYVVNAPANRRVTLLKTADEVKVRVAEKRGLAIIIGSALGRWL